MKQLKQHWSFALSKCCITENILMPWACIKPFRSNSFGSLIVYTVNDQRDSKTLPYFDSFNQGLTSLSEISSPWLANWLCNNGIVSGSRYIQPCSWTSSKEIELSSPWKRKTTLKQNDSIVKKLYSSNLAECLRTTKIVPCRRLTTRVDPSDSGRCDWVSRQSQSGHCDHPAVGLALAITLRSQVIAWARLKGTDPCSQTTARDDPCRLKAFGALSQAVAPRTKRFTKIVTECHWFIHWTDL